MHRQASLGAADGALQVKEGVGAMFNTSTRREAVERLKRSLAEHETVRKQVEQAGVRLFEQRQRAVAEVIEPVEAYVNSLANTPKEFDRVVREYRIEVDRFEDTVERIETEAAQTAQVGGGVGATGALAGAGVAVFGPTAAMAVATTFGIASTGTAISTLSGAAATNAALAWLGGGGMAAGGGGMAAGNALLALAGPVGWSIGGAALMGSGVYLRYRNRALAWQATQERVKVEGEIRSLKTADREIAGLEKSTRAHTEGTLADLRWLREHAPSRGFLDVWRACLRILGLGGRGPNDYRRFTPPQKERLAALINHVRSLSELLRQEIVL